MIWIVIYAAVYGWMALACLWCTFQTQRFLETTPTIADEGSLGRFKTVARTSMYLALVQIPVFLIGLAAGVALILRSGSTALAVVLGANGVVLVMALYLRTLEQRARSLPAATEELAQQRRRISETWVKKPFPDF